MENDVLLMNWWSKEDQQQFSYLEDEGGKMVVDVDIVLGSSRNLRVKENVGYIVCGVIFRGSSRENAEVLMIQEVDGSWYLPAGRMEPGETIEEGMKREVKEEAGIECESLGLICVEAVRSAWFRFTYLANKSGGALKTYSQRDQESLQASWFPASSVQIHGHLAAGARLRSRDIVRLVQLGLDRRFGEQGQQQNGGAGANSNHQQQQQVTISKARVIERPVPGLWARFILVREDAILVRRDHFPLVEYSLTQHLAETVKKFIKAVTNCTHESVLNEKTVCVEARPIPAYQHDGCCFTIFIQLSNNGINNKESSSIINQSAAEDGYRLVPIASISQELSKLITNWRNGGDHAILYLM